MSSEDANLKRVLGWLYDEHFSVAGEWGHTRPCEICDVLKAAGFKTLKWPFISTSDPDYPGEDD